MIWGETDDAYSARLHTPHRWFAWRPVLLEDGRWAWLQTVERQWKRYGPVTEMSEGACFFYRPLA